jgi:hypothetical protein
VLIRVSPLLLEIRKLIQNSSYAELRDGERQTRTITHLPRTMARYIRSPMVRFHKMKYSVLIGSIPMIIAGMSSIACCETLPQTKVRTIPITRANTPSESFEMRWLPVAEIPKRVRTLAIKAATTNEVVDTARPVVAPDDTEVVNISSAKDVAHVRPRNIRYNRRDQRTCVRHNMRTVYYGKHRWRCRR